MNFGAGAYFVILNAIRHNRMKQKKCKHGKASILYKPSSYISPSKVKDQEKKWYQFWK